MRVTVDMGKCQGYANCIGAAPGIFDLGEDTNKAIVLVDEVPQSMAADAWQAEASCPAHAITIHE